MMAECYKNEWPNLIRIITLTGSDTFTSGYVDGMTALAVFCCPDGIAIDNAGNIYISDAGNSVIRKIAAGPR